MKDTIALQSLSKITENYEKNYKALHAAKQRIRTLTRQRDQANARNAELRDVIARYQSELAEARTELRKQRTSAWDDIPVLRVA
jgi:F0F1-type ATP synthase membrane subunit b/b'